MHQNVCVIWEATDLELKKPVLCTVHSCTLVSQAGWIKHLYRYRKYTKSQPLLSLQVESEHSQEVGYNIGWQLN